jgi:hypothetical protein
MEDGWKRMEADHGQAITSEQARIMGIARLHRDGRVIARPAIDGAEDRQLVHDPRLQG